MALYYPQCHTVLSVAFDGFGPNEADLEPRIIPVRPSQATVVRNSYRQADSWELTFEAEEFPMDPRMVRTGQAEIWLYATRSLEEKRLVVAQGSLDVPVIPRSLLEASQEEAETAVADGRGRGGAKVKRPTIAGLFDEHSIEYSNSGKWVSIHGQDYTALLIAKQWPPLPSGRARKIPVGDRLDRTISALLAEADTTGRMALTVEGIPALEMPMVTAGAVGNKRGIPVEQETSYWDVMYKLAKRHGLILFVRGVEVVLAKPFNISANNVSRVRSMAWGRNLETLEMSRKLGMETAPSVIVTGYDKRARKTVFAEWPVGTRAKVNEGARTTKTTGGGTTKAGKKRKTNIKHSEEYVIVQAYEISDPVVLQEMARREFVMRGKNERTVRFRTKDLTDLLEKDLLDLATGDAFDVTIKEWIYDQAAIRKEGLGLAQRIQYLEGRGYSPAIARIIADKFSEIDFLDRPLAVREVTYEWDEQDGIGIEAELIDFIVVDGIRDQEAKAPRRKDQRLAVASSEPMVSRKTRKARKDQHK